MEAAVKQEITKIETGIEKRMQHYHDMLLGAYEQSLAEIKEDIKSSKHLVTFVATAMKVVKNNDDLHATQRKNLIVDVIHKIIAAMPVAHDEKQTIHNLFLPSLVDLIDVIEAAAKGHLIFRPKPAPVPAPRRLFRLKLFGGVVIHAQRGLEDATTPSVAVVVDVVPVVNDVYQSVKCMLLGKQINMASLISIGSLIMQVVDQYPQLSGAQKKQIVLQVAHNIVGETELDVATKQMINAAIDTTLDMAIEFIIKAKNGQIDVVNKIEASVKSCCAPKKAAATPQ